MADTLRPVPLTAGAADVHSVSRATARQAQPDTGGRGFGAQRPPRRAGDGNVRTSRTVVQRFADWLRYTVADRIDPDGTPRSPGWTFTFEIGVGLVWHEGHNGPGCPVWYIGEQDYRRAHDEAQRCTCQGLDPAALASTTGLATMLAEGRIDIDCPVHGLAT